MKVEMEEKVEEVVMVEEEGTVCVCAVGGRKQAKGPCSHSAKGRERKKQNYNSQQSFIELFSSLEALQQQPPPASCPLSFTEEETSGNTRSKSSHDITSPAAWAARLGSRQPVRQPINEPTNKPSIHLSSHPTSQSSNPLACQSSIQSIIQLINHFTSELATQSSNSSII